MSTVVANTKNDQYQFGIDALQMVRKILLLFIEYVLLIIDRRSSISHV
jgi:hypothetical protein